MAARDAQDLVAELDGPHRHRHELSEARWCDGQLPTHDVPGGSQARSMRVRTNSASFGCSSPQIALACATRSNAMMSTANDAS